MDTHSTRSGNGSRSATRGRLAQQLKEDGKTKIESGKQSAAQQLDRIADAIDAAGVQLDKDQPTIASYASRLASGASNVASRLRDSSIQDLGRDVRTMATRNPALYLLGGVALGAVLVRIMRVSEGNTAESAATGETIEDAGDDSTDTLKEAGGEDSRSQSAAVDSDVNAGDAIDVSDTPASGRESPPRSGL